MKNIVYLIYLFTAITIFPSCKNKRESEVKNDAKDTCKWSSFDYFYARAYMIHDVHYIEAIEDKANLNPYILKDKQWDLTTEDIDALNHIFCGRIKEESVDRTASDCFNPRLVLFFTINKSNWWPMLLFVLNATR